MVYVVEKHEWGFILTDRMGEKREFADADAVANFLAGWALKGMKPGEQKYVTDVEVVHSAIG